MYSLGKSQVLLWESIVSNIDVCTTGSLKWAYEMHHEIHSQLSIHFTLGPTLRGGGPHLARSLITPFHVSEPYSATALLNFNDVCSK